MGQTYTDSVGQVAADAKDMSSDTIASLPDAELQEPFSEKSPDNVHIRYRVKPDYILREIAGESILVPLGESTVFGNSMISMNETSSFLWKFFKKAHTIQEAVSEAANVYEGTQEMFARHISEFVTTYVKYGLLYEEE